MTDDAGRIRPNSLAGTSLDPDLVTLDDLPFTHDDGRIPNGAQGRRCRHPASARMRVVASDLSDERMTLGGELPEETCGLCGHDFYPTARRRGRSSLRAGKDAERAVAKAYGGKRTGQYGGPDDVVVGDLFVIQSKAGRTWFQQRVVDELDKLPRAGGRIPTRVVSSRPGPGHPTRRYVVRLLEDDVALPGERP